MATIKSIAEKARAYDKAIEKLRSLHDDYDTVSTLIDIKEELENIFPELKESEDERMRNVAINACKYMIDNFENSTKQYEDAIAWLEKQGEQNLANSAKTCKDEQKHWSEEDKKIVTELIGIFESAIDGGHVAFPYRLLKDYIRILKLCQPQLQSKDTWKPSERQKEALLWCVVHLGGADKQTLGELLEALNKL